eukprot:6213774-Pleurochrysis_carterae.AAC.1
MAPMGWRWDHDHVGRAGAECDELLTTRRRDLAVSARARGAGRSFTARRVRSSSSAKSVITAIRSSRAWLT